MRPFVPALLVLALLTAGPSLPSVGADEPEDDDPLSLIFENEEVTIILDQNITLLGMVTLGSQNPLTLVPKDLYITTCYPCQGTRIPTYFTDIPDQCPLGPRPQDEQKVCLYDRAGAPITLDLVQNSGQALVAFGDGCIVNRAVDGFPPQKVTFEGLALPAAQLTIGSIGCV